MRSIREQQEDAERTDDLLIDSIHCSTIIHYGSSCGDEGQEDWKKTGRKMNGCDEALRERRRIDRVEERVQETVEIADVACSEAGAVTSCGNSAVEEAAAAIQKYQI